MNPLDASQFWKPFRANSRRFQEVFSHHKEHSDLVEQTETLAYLIRSYAVYSMTCAALGHPGGSFSEAELLAVMYNYVLRYDSQEPKWPGRDVFYLSKCHACPGLYAALALVGYFPVGDLTRYGEWGSHLESHPDSTTTPGIEISGGSLGQIPGVAVGRALGIRRHGPDQADRMVYVLIGDGECNEGSVWEAFMAAGHYRLDNLVFIIDYNKVQAKGFVQQDMSIEPLADKLAAFNLQPWQVSNGHNVADLVDLFNTLHTQRRGKPNAVILSTIKGKGIGMCQYNPNWHTSAPRTIEAAQRWLGELWERDGHRLGIPQAFHQALGDAIHIVPPLHENPDRIVEKQA
ncbi:MAG: transketolase [Phycisphaerae bacterium]|nr:transketolase [Phycisphaerae bacterium]